jgi:hypothetical protein
VRRGGGQGLALAGLVGVCPGSRRAREGVVAQKRAESVRSRVVAPVTLVGASALGISTSSIMLRATGVKGNLGSWIGDPQQILSHGEGSPNFGAA